MSDPSNWRSRLSAEDEGVRDAFAESSLLRLATMGDRLFTSLSEQHGQWWVASAEKLASRCRVLESERLGFQASRGARTPERLEG